jgi:hypothetical protein
LRLMKWPMASVWKAFSEPSAEMPRLSLKSMAGSSVHAEESHSGRMVKWQG